MNLINGQLVDNTERDRWIDDLDKLLIQTLSAARLDADTVINACEKLASRLESDGERFGLSAQEIDIARRLCSRQSLQARIDRELGEVGPEQAIYPLGVLLHITAGNQFALALYSVIEGLLCGNINLVKLASGEHTLVIAALLALIDAEPCLVDYIYVFDYRSHEQAAMKDLMDLADAVVIWGGDKSIQSVRQMASPNTRIIEWGHKIGFAYISSQVSDEELFSLAKHIATTMQLLCSSCQGIYLDSDDISELYQLAKRFLPILDSAFSSVIEELSIAVRAQRTLQRYAASLESAVSSVISDDGMQLYQGQYSSITVESKSELEMSQMYGHCWIKALPRTKIIGVLKANKNHLQTAGLVCREDDFEHISQLLFRSGVCRVTTLASMSELDEAGAHDGEFPLRRYTRIVSVEQMA